MEYLHVILGCKKNKKAETKLLTEMCKYLYLRFEGCIALELGAGLGLCSIVLGRVAEKVLCTGIV